jgi:hypothetical protein
MKSFNVMRRSIRWTWTTTGIALVFAVTASAPWWLVKIPAFGELPSNLIGDYLGGIGTYMSSVTTIFMLYLVWSSERRDDRKAAFMSSLMVLLQLHVAERQRLLDSHKNGGYFQWFWESSIHLLLATSDTASRRQKAEAIYDQHYDKVASWFLSVLRVIRFIEDSDQPENEKHEAMKLFRLFCEREEQRALFVLLFMKDDRAESPRLLLKHEFFKYAGFKEYVELSNLWATVPNGWKNM